MSRSGGDAVNYSSHDYKSVLSLILNAYGLPEQIVTNNSHHFTADEFAHIYYTVGPVLIAWFNYCVLAFASELRIY